MRRQLRPLRRWGAAEASPSPVALANDALALADWRRRVFELYRDVREARDPAAAWRGWRAGRHELFVHHPQSPPDQPLVATSGSACAWPRRRTDSLCNAESANSSAHDQRTPTATSVQLTDCPELAGAVHRSTILFDR
jgi:hypothetical protein